MKRVWLLLPWMFIASCGESSSDTVPVAPDGGAGSSTGGQAGTGTGGSGGTSAAGTGGSSVGGTSGSAGVAGKGGSGGSATGGSAGTAGVAGSGGTLPTPIRKVETRSPFGDLSASSNLVLDGDLEFSPASSIVPAWMAIEGQAYAPLSYETGGHCYSGIYCAVVKPDATLVNFAVSLPPGQSIDASVRIKPEDKQCNGVQAVLYVGTGTSDDGTVLSPENPDPDTSGWCTLTSQWSVPATVRTSAFYVVANGASVVVDDVVIGTSKTRKKVITQPLAPALRERGRLVETYRPRRPVRKPASPPAIP